MGELILERHCEVLKRHVEDGNRLTEGHWESIDTLWELRDIGASSEEKCTAECSLLGWAWGTCGLITRQSQERTRLQYDYRVHLEDDRSTRLSLIHI